MGRKAILIGLVLCANALAPTHAPIAANVDWLCTEQASERQGDAIFACGVGTGTNENQARLDAFDNSKAEFTRVCILSADCKDREITIEPKRTTCEQEKGTYKCYRLIVFYIGSTKTKLTPRAYSESADDFRPFVYSESKDQPKVKVGMTKAELLATFGAPESVYTESEVSPPYGHYFSFVYRRKLCVDKSGVLACFIDVKDGKVTGYREVDPLYADMLK